MSITRVAFAVLARPRSGESVATWCFRPEGDLPIADVMLAQKIALENNEQAGLALANRGSSI